LVSSLRSFDSDPCRLNFFLRTMAMANKFPHVAVIGIDLAPGIMTRTTYLVTAVSNSMMSTEVYRTSTANGLGAHAVSR
jgi:hypothetical protein